MGQRGGDHFLPGEFGGRVARECAQSVLQNTYQGLHTATLFVASHFLLGPLLETFSFQQALRALSGP